MSESNIISYDLNILECLKLGLDHLEIFLSFKPALLQDLIAVLCLLQFIFYFQQLFVEFTDRCRFILEK